MCVWCVCVCVSVYGSYVCLGGACDRTDARGHYFKGDYVPKSETTALSWLTRAVDLGDMHALVLLGTWYLYGCCVPKDWTRAEQCWTTAADMGLSRAMVELGLLCRERKQYEMAFQWWRQAYQTEPTGEVMRYLGYVSSRFKISTTHASRCSVS